MKIKCPNCQTDLRYIASSKLFLCNDCGYHIAGEPDPEPVKVQSVEPISSVPKPRITHPALRKYKPWDFKSGRFIYLGVSLAAIAVLSLGIRQYQQYQTSKEIDAAIASSQKLIEEVRASQINIKDLPAICQPRNYIHLSYKMFEECFPDGVTHDQVFDMIGSPGRLVSQNGSISIYQWRGNYDSVVTMSFQNSRLIGKNQINLNLDTMADYEPKE